MREEGMSEDGYGLGRDLGICSRNGGSGETGNNVVVADNSTTWEEVKKVFYLMCLRKRPNSSVADCACAKDSSKVCSCAWDEETRKEVDVTNGLRKPLREALLLTEVSSALAGMGCGLKETEVRDVEEFYFRCKGDGIYVLNASSEYNDSVGAGLFGSPAGRELTGANAGGTASSGCGGGWRRRRKKVVVGGVTGAAGSKKFTSMASVAPVSPSTAVRIGFESGEPEAEEGRRGHVEGTRVDVEEDNVSLPGCERTSGMDALSVASRVFRCVLAAGMGARGDREGKGRRLEARRSSDDLFEEAAQMWGLTCQMNDNCRCMDCQSHYFDCDFDRGSEEEFGSPPPSPPPTPPHQWLDTADTSSAETALAGDHQLASDRHASCCLL